MNVRHAEPADYGRVIGRVNAWWGGRDMAPMLPRLFFVHFEGTSYVVDDEDGQLAAFLIGFLSQTRDDEAYIHFVGVSPEHRGAGLGRILYERFFQDVRSRGIPIVLISHNMPHVFEVSDRIHVHRLGRRLCVVNPKDYTMSDAVAFMTGAKEPPREAVAA